MYVHAQKEHLESISRVIDATENPHHKAILRNYQVHVALEQSTKWGPILSDEMSVQRPHYRFSFYGTLNVFDGRDEVNGLYEAGVPNVAVLRDEKLAVNDFGLVAAATHLAFADGAKFMAENGATGLDPDTHYVESSPVMMLWEYTPDAKLIGEKIYQVEPPVYTAIARDQACTKESMIADCEEFLSSVGVAV